MVLAYLDAGEAVRAAEVRERFDHPATDCAIMGSEIDRRLTENHEPNCHQY